MADEWYYSHDGESAGPVPAAQLKQLAGKEQLRPHDLIWKPGLPQWVPASSVKGLFTPEQIQKSRPRPEAIPVQPVDMPAGAFTAETRGHAAAATLDEPVEDFEEVPADEGDRPRRKPKKGKGMSRGMLIGLIGGGGGLLLLVLILVLFLFMGGGGESGEFTTTIAPLNKYERTVYLNKDKRYDFEFKTKNNEPIAAVLEYNSGGATATLGINTMFGGPRQTIQPMFTGSWKLTIANLGGAPMEVTVKYGPQKTGGQ